MFGLFELILRNIDKCCAERSWWFLKLVNSHRKERNLNLGFTECYFDLCYPSAYTCPAWRIVLTHLWVLLMSDVNSSLLFLTSSCEVHVSDLLCMELLNLINKPSERLYTSGVIMRILNVSIYSSPANDVYLIVLHIDMLTSEKFYLSLRTRRIALRTHTSSTDRNTSSTDRC